MARSRGPAVCRVPGRARRRRRRRRPPRRRRPRPRCSPRCPASNTDPVTDDADWLRAAARGEPVAVRRLLDEAGPVVYGYVHARVGGDDDVAADIVQDTFFEAMRGAESFRGDAAVTTWLCAIASRRLIRHYEAERRQAEARRGLYGL